MLHYSLLRVTVITALLFCFEGNLLSQDRIVTVTLLDNSKYDVAEFRLYTDHVLGGGTYFSSTKDHEIDLILKTDSTWKEINPDSIKMIHLNRFSNKYLKAYIEMKKGNLLNGLVPIDEKGPGKQDTTFG